MPLLYPNALTDPAAYLQAQDAWRQLFDRIKCEDYRGPMWTEWMSGVFANGTLCYDGSMSIYNQVCNERGKGIIVWILDPQEAQDSGEIFHALMEPWGEFGEIDTLDISCVLTDENLARAEELIRLYMVDDQPPEAMGLRIEAKFPAREDEVRTARPLAVVAMDYGLRKHFCALRGLLGNVLASYDASPAPGVVFSAAMQFTKEDRDKTLVIEAGAHREGEQTRLSYELGPRDTAVRTKGPTASISAGCDAPDDARVVKRWLNAITQFVEENRALLP